MDKQFEDGLEIRKQVMGEEFGARNSWPRLSPAPKAYIYSIYSCSK
ncbi:hypothetical protein SAMN04515619_11985 [Collimonas sp. OK412]|jgi:hypothetical protein|nr:hypothetical protein SAMN04515619_11985 [Collimonas sp. OK412]